MIPYPIDTRPLWERALDARRAERAKLRRAPNARKDPRTVSYNRKHPKAKVGDTFGLLVVVALVTTEKWGRLDETVIVRCPNGHERKVFVFNLRVSATCRQCRRKRP